MLDLLCPPQRTARAAAVAALLCAVCAQPAVADALDDPCERRESTASDAAPTSLRGKASRFAPRLIVRLWFRPGADTQQRESAQSSALAEAPSPLPRPTRLDADVEEPFGWEISLRWDLAEMAEAVAPTALSEPDTLLPSECMMQDRTAARFIDDYDEGELQ